MVAVVVNHMPALVERVEFNFGFVCYSDLGTVAVLNSKHRVSSLYLANSESISGVVLLLVSVFPNWVAR